MAAARKLVGRALVVKLRQRKRLYAGKKWECDIRGKWVRETYLVSAGALPFSRELCYRLDEPQATSAYPTSSRGPRASLHPHPLPTPCLPPSRPQWRTSRASSRLWRARWAPRWGCIQASRRRAKGHVSGPRPASAAATPSAMPSATPYEAKARGKLPCVPLLVVGLRRSKASRSS